jgi:hypothetical protein
MSHNYEARESGVGGERSRQFTLDDADIYFHDNPPRCLIYFPQAQRMAVPPACAPTQAASGGSRYGSSGSGDRQCSVPYARPSSGIVIRDG